MLDFFLTEDLKRDLYIKKTWNVVTNRQVTHKNEKIHKLNLNV